MPDLIHQVQSRLEFIPQKFNPLVLQLTQWLLPVLLRLRFRPWLTAGIAQIEAINAETLVNCYQQFQSGKIRFLMAFRHPEVDDPLCMMYLLSRIVPRIARKSGIKLQYPIHSYFMYDRGMTLWAGNWLGWLFSRLGGMSIRRGKRIDKIGLQAARELFVNGKLPISVAPEGATNGHSGIVSQLQPGVAQLGFWCVEDLHKANRVSAVFIVPIGIQYRYLQPPWEKLDLLLRELEADSGLGVSGTSKNKLDDGDALEGEPRSDRTRIFSQRILRLAEYLLCQMEDFYRRFYHQNLPEPILPILNADPSTSPNEVLHQRLQILLNTALQVAEQYFGLESRGSLIERCRHLEEAGWSYIYREDISSVEALSPFQRGLADWIASEASIRMQHMRLVESFVAVTGTYIQEKPTPERFAEMALLMFDMMARVKGKKYPRRPRLGWRYCQLTVGEPISLTARWSTYQTSRQAARGAVADLTSDLQMALEKLIS